MAESIKSNPIGEAVTLVVEDEGQLKGNRVVNELGVLKSYLVKVEKTQITL